MSHYYNDINIKYMSNKLLLGDAESTQFLGLGCKRESGLILNIWAQNLGLFFLL